MPLANTSTVLNNTLYTLPTDLWGYIWITQHIFLAKAELVTVVNCICSAYKTDT